MTALTSLIGGDEEAMYDLVKRIIEANMCVSIKAMFFHVYKLPPQEQWSGPDGVYTKITTDLCCIAQTVLKVIMHIADNDLDVAVRAASRGGHNKKIRLVTAAEYKKKLDKLLKEKRNSKTVPKGCKSAWDDYDGNNPLP